MADPRGFMKAGRQEASARPVPERVKDFKHVTCDRSAEQAKTQASRCMDCGTPFCHWGCPVGNFIPEWNDSMYQGRWQQAFEFLDATNNLPEITGRVCPAPCEHSCVLGINDAQVTIRENELDIIEYAFKNSLAKPCPPPRESGKRAAIVGSGPAGLSCAAQLRKAGHQVTVFERDDELGGILRYGIPDFKLEKWVIDRRLDLFRKEGILFQTGAHIGQNYPVAKLLEEFDAVCLACGSRVPRDLNVEGRDFSGIHFAMDYLTQANKIASGAKIPAEKLIDAAGKKVLVIGGGDTGSDCIGTANRQGASAVVQIEILPKPPLERSEDRPWPLYSGALKTTSSHEEGGERKWLVLTKRFIGEKGRVTGAECVQVEFERFENGRPAGMKEIPGSDFVIEADLVLLAMGFLHPEHAGLVEGLGVSKTPAGNIGTGSNYQTSVPKVFCAGDMRRGQSLVVWAIAEGRGAARAMDQFLTGESYLPL